MALKVGTVIQVWKNFDLPGLQRELDAEAAEVARRQDESDAGRRRLIDLSREFKKTASEDVKAAVAPLLKNFQSEVDGLNKRSKAAEVVFLNVYKKLTDINDPVPLLEMIPSLQQKTGKQQDLELEVKQLRDTLAEYNEEFRQVRNQDVTIKQLKEKLRQAEDLMETTVQARLKDNEEKMSRHFEERERELMELNSVATRRLTETEGRIAALQAIVSELQSELFDSRTKADEAAYAKSEEMDMLMMDLERANQRCLLAEKEVVSLKEQLLAGSGRGQANEAPPSADTPLDMMARPSSLQFELASKEKEVQSLIEDVQRLQSTLAELRESSAQQLARLEEELQVRSKHIQRLENQLEAQKDYEEIRRELGVLKSIEFPHVAAGSNSSATSTAVESGPESGSGSEAKPLELLLLERNKTLQSENTELKVSNTDLQVKGESEEQQAATPATSRSASPGLDQTPLRPSTVLASGFLPQFLPPPVFHPAALGLSSLNPFLKEDLILHWRRNLEAAVPERQSPDPVRARKPSGCSDAYPEASDLSRSGGPNWEDAHLAKLQQEFIARGGVYPALGTTTNTDDNGPTLPEGLTSLLAKNNPLEARLQEMLRATMERFSNQSLDTLAISRGVRELLSVHNIGQRLFAKFVLGLSQGTVSELLSKPKPWDKLTEKGRDSYRKMHAWACDEAAVLLLKSLIPRKGKEAGSSSNRADDSSSATEERIAHILSEASAALRTQQPDASPASDSETKSPSQAQTPSPGPRNELKRGRKAEHDDISQEQLLRIYHEELAKMMSGTVTTAFNPALGGFSTLARNAPANCKDFSRTADEMRLAYDAYQQELARWMQSSINPYSLAHTLSGTAQDLSSSQRSGSEEAPIKREDTGEVKVKTEPSINSILRPTLTPPVQEEGSTGSVSGSGVASPLQRIASITNSLMTQSSNPVLGSGSHRPAKAILPPITQQQFDTYQNLSTEEVVRKVKEQLSQYSISQRLFGESVLGLSQGSVSDLLARPKPWHMLTQKGREPFIRMKIFLEDENAIHKLVASQYKIAPDKLMRTGGFTGITQPLKGQSRTGTPPSSQAGSSPLFRGDFPANPPTLAGTALRSGPGGALGLNSELSQISPGLPLGANLAHFMSIPSRLARFQAGIDSNAASPKEGPEASGAGTFPSQGVYELAALTQDLDTQGMTTRIKEVLLANNIGQKLFGEVVLGLSQGSVSELLSKPKPWHMLSIKGREPFIRMQLWLSDPRGVEQLQRIRNERRDGAKKRSRDPASSDSLNSTAFPDNSSNDEASSPSAASPCPSAAKKQRVFFSNSQKDALKLAFSMDPYPSPATMDFLAHELHLSNKTIANWFHNHRMRLKQQQNNNSDPDIQTAGSKDQDHFDPVRFRLALHRKNVALEDPPTNRMSGFKLAPPLQSLYTNGILAQLGFSSREEESCAGSEGLDLTLSRTGQGHSESDDVSDCESSVESERAAVLPAQTRSPRRSRKPAAPQWVNPHWQDSLSKNDDKGDPDESKDEEKQTDDNEDQC